MQLLKHSPGCLGVALGEDRAARRGVASDFRSSVEVEYVEESQQKGPISLLRSSTDRTAPNAASQTSGTMSEAT
jgi:hypothetical protein